MRKYFEKYDQITLQQCRATLNNPKIKDLYLKFWLENGKTLIVEGIENEVEPIVDPVLEKQIQGKQKQNSSMLREPRLIIVMSDHKIA